MIKRTFKGLPFHQWAHLNIQYMAMDDWEEDSLSVEICMQGVVANLTYDNRQRHFDLCGESAPDNLGNLDAYVEHY